MVPSVQLIKYQALGNDYLVADPPAPLSDLLEVLPALCDRHLGLGADGLLAFQPSCLAVRIFNPDRSEAQRSGNGLRIAAAHAVLEHGAPERFALTTIHRRNPVRVLSTSGPTVVTELDIGIPSFRASDLPADFPGEPGRVRLVTATGEVTAVLVSVGNPHCVVLDEVVSPERCRQLGPLLEGHPAFPERVNVQLVEPLSRDRARIEIWERGAGYTLASGTSASAVAAALMREGLAGDHVTIVMPGGELPVSRGADGSLSQRGPASRVYRASIDLDDLRRGPRAE